MTPFQYSSGPALLFPGIGVRPFGRENEFFHAYETLMGPYLFKASVSAGTDIAALLRSGTVYCQKQFVREIFTYAFACGTFSVFMEKEIRPRCMAGHSLGVYGAMVSAQALSFEDGLFLIEKAHQLGRRYSGVNTFGVAAVIGLSHEEVMGWVLAKGYGSVVLANLNSESSCVYAGYRQEIERLLAWAEEEGAIKAIGLEIDLPFHHPIFMKKAATDFRPYLEEISWQKPLVPIVSALDQSIITEAEDLKEMTAVNLCSTINWPATIRALAGMGVEEVIECGAGLSLTQHGRFIGGAPRHYNLKNLRRWLNY